MAISVMDTEVERLLAHGKEAAKAGDNVLARSLLTQVVERDPHSEQAWMWLSGVVSEPEEQQICLENVLVINPNNPKARKGLEFLSTKTGVPATLPAPADRTAPLSGFQIAGSQSPTMGQDAAVAPHNPPAEAPAQPDPMFSPGIDPFAPSQAFAPVPHAPGALPDDPWGGNGTGAAGGYSADSLNIDWSRGVDVAPGPVNNGFGAPATNQPEQWPAMDMFGQAANAAQGGAPPWSLDNNMQGFEPMQAGTLHPSDPGAQFGGQSAAEDWNGTGMLSPMSVSDYQLPNPNELPGYAREAQPEAKPWYAQSSQLDPSMMSATGNLSNVDTPNSDELTRHLNSFKDKPAVMVQCPNCHEEVADTSLSCPNCNFSFFINCPNCHELVDTVDSKADTQEPCPYCNTMLDKMQLGMSNADPTIAYVTEKPAKPEPTPRLMTQQVAVAAGSGRGYSWSWVVDVMWLVAIAVMVWALTQIPAWFHLVGQY